MGHFLEISIAGRVRESGFMVDILRHQKLCEHTCIYTYFYIYTGEWVITKTKKTKKYIYIMFWCCVRDLVKALLKWLVLVDEFNAA